MNIINIIHENLEALDVTEDFFKVAKRCRESYYQLSSLQSHCEKITAQDSLYKVMKFAGQVKDFESSFHANDIASTYSHDYELSTPKFTELEIDRIYNRLKNNLNLICQMDKLQIDILTFLVNYKRNQSKQLVKEEPLLSDLYEELETEYFIKIVFLHSCEEDKITNYKLDSKKTEYKKFFKNKNQTLPEHLNLKDHSFIVKKRRIEYQHWHSAYMELLRARPKVREESILRNIAEKQFVYNKHVTYLTYLVTILTVVTTYFGVLDHWSTVIQAIEKMLGILKISN